MLPTDFGSALLTSSLWDRVLRFMRNRNREDVLISPVDVSAAPVPSRRPWRTPYVIRPSGALSSKFAKRPRTPTTTTLLIHIPATSNTFFILNWVANYGICSIGPRLDVQPRYGETFLAGKV